MVPPCIVSEIKRRIGRKSRFFTPLNSKVEKSLTTRLAPLEHNTGVWQTDGHLATAQSALRIASRSKNWVAFFPQYFTYRFQCIPHVSQEAQLSQRGRAMLCVIEYFAKSLKITQGRRKEHHWTDRIRVSIGVPYGLILYHFRDKARYWSKIVIFAFSWYTPPFDATLGGPSRNTAITFGIEKLKWCGYPTVKKVWWYAKRFASQKQR